MSPNVGKTFTNSPSSRTFCLLQKMTCLVIWDATVTDTFAPSYLHLAVREAGAVAAAAEERNKIKYSNLTSCASYCFTPVAVETSGALGPATMNFIKELGRRLTQAMGEEEATTRLLQRLSVSVQLGNAASVMGTLSSIPHLLLVR